MEIRELDTYDDAAMTRFYAIMRAAELHEREGMPFWSEREATVMLRRKEEGEAWTCFGAFEGEGADEVMVGNALMMRPLLDNTRFAFVEVNVEPARRNQGIGTALTRHVVDAARALGRTRLLTEVNLKFEDRETHPYRRFAEHRGFALANVEVRRTLDLPVDDQQIQAWVDEAAPHHVDYRIETHVNGVPDELVPSLVHVLNQLALDAPTGDLEFEAEAMTPQGYRDRCLKVQEMGRTLFETVAIGPDGDVVAQSTIGVSQEDPDNVFQWGTLVRRDHRGHRLGLAVKATNLRAMQRAHPEQKRIVTTNAETNAPMVSINEAIGFKPVELLAEFQLVFEED